MTDATWVMRMRWTNSIDGGWPNPNGLRTVTRTTKKNSQIKRKLEIFYSSVLPKRRTTLLIGRDWTSPFLIRTIEQERKLSIDGTYLKQTNSLNKPTKLKDPN